jgi:hypothetical protein
MILSFLKFKSSYAAVIVVTALFLYSAFLGFSKGKSIAQAKANLFVVQELSKGLDSFFKDQDRFPDAQEFGNKNVLLGYFTALPEVVFTNAVCSQNFIYKRLNETSYELDFCLATGVSPYSQGWNKINEQK